MDRSLQDLEQSVRKSLENLDLILDLELSTDVAKDNGHGNHL